MKRNPLVSLLLLILDLLDDKLLQSLDDFNLYFDQHLVFASMKKREGWSLFYHSHSWVTKRKLHGAWSCKLNCKHILVTYVLYTDESIVWGCKLVNSGVDVMAQPAG